MNKNQGGKIWPEICQLTTNNIISQLHQRQIYPAAASAVETKFDLWVTHQGFLVAGFCSDPIQLIFSQCCIYASVNWVSIGSDNGLSPDWHEAIISTNAGILLIGSLGTNFSEIRIKIQTVSFMKMHFEMSSEKCCPCCPGVDELNCQLGEAIWPWIEWVEPIMQGDYWCGDDLIQTGTQPTWSGTEVYLTCFMKSADVWCKIGPRLSISSVFFVMALCIGFTVHIYDIKTTVKHWIQWSGKMSVFWRNYFDLIFTSMMLCYSLAKVLSVLMLVLLGIALIKTWSTNRFLENLLAIMPSGPKCYTK